MKNARIKVFNRWWWFYVILTAVSLAVINAIANRQDIDTRFRIIFVLSVIELIVLRIYKFSLKDIREDYNYYNEFPCYLCNQSTILCIIGSLTRNIGVMSFCVTIGTLGASLAFLMPDSYNRDQLVFSKQAYGFYGYHGLLIVTCLSFYTMYLYEPKLIDCLYAPLGIFILAVIAHIINTILRKTGLNEKANYVYTWYHDNTILKKLYDLLPVRLLYLWPVMPIFMAYSFVFLFILKIFRQ